MVIVQLTKFRFSNVQRINLSLKSLISRGTIAQNFYKVEKVPSYRNAEKQKKKPIRSFDRKFKEHLSNYLRQLNSPEVEKELSPLRAAVSECKERIEELKENRSSNELIRKAVEELKGKKKQLEERELDLAPKDASFDRVKLEELLRRRYFYDNSFSIYGGSYGLNDFGPLGCAMKTNIIDEWRNHFVHEERMLQMETSVLTPECVLKVSGHVDRFNDWVVKDLVTNDCFRATHLIKEHLQISNEISKTEADNVLAKLDSFDGNELHQVVRRFEIKSPVGNELSEPMMLNLMFPTNIGPFGQGKAYLRPEIAQGIFVNFNRLLKYNQGKLPFAAAQIGLGFRNEVCSYGMIRTREFTMCEIEHFYDPIVKRHDKFESITESVLILHSASNQLAGKPPEMWKVKNAVKKNIIANEIVAYYMSRVQDFLVKVGIDLNKIRFRQHLPNEMAHYANDCWDAEIFTSYDWVECVGIADRACFDLQQHQDATKVDLKFQRGLEEPRIESVVKIFPNKSVLKKKFGDDAKKILGSLRKVSSDDVQDMQKDFLMLGYSKLNVDDKEMHLDKNMIEFKLIDKKVSVESITPSVIEPSFGINRILYCVLEHSFREREGEEDKRFFALPPQIAPVKCSLLRISVNVELDPIFEFIQEELRKHRVVFHEFDGSISVGKCYVQSDEIGIPFGITVDFESKIEPCTVTLRNAVTTEQIRIEVKKICSTVLSLISGVVSWQDLLTVYPKHEWKPK